jgi:hypothetical protein
LIKPIAKIYSQGFQEILFHIFMSFISFSMHFRILNEFLEKKLIKKEFKKWETTRAVLAQVSTQGHRPNAYGSLARATGHNAEWACACGPATARVAWPPSVEWCAHHPWSPRGGHARGGMVARPTPAEERPKRSNVFEESIMVRRGNHRTRRQGEGSPKTVTRRLSSGSCATRLHSMAVEARGHWRRAPMSPVDGEERGG